MMNALIRPKPRVKFEHHVSMMPLDGSSPRIRARACNVSEGGMFVRTAALLARGTKVEVNLVTHEFAFPFATAEVVWGRHEETRSGFGLRFCDVRPGAKALISQLVRVNQQPCVQ